LEIARIKSLQRITSHPLEPNTYSDREDLKERGVSYLITTTPQIDGRSFGTNVIEAALMAINAHEREYLSVLEKSNLRPSIEKLK